MRSRKLFSVGCNLDIFFFNRSPESEQRTERYYVCTAIRYVSCMLRTLGYDTWESSNGIIVWICSWHQKFSAILLHRQLPLSSIAKHQTRVSFRLASFTFRKLNQYITPQVIGSNRVRESSLPFNGVLCTVRVRTTRKERWFRSWTNCAVEPQSFYSRVPALLVDVPDRAGVCAIFEFRSICTFCPFRPDYAGCPIVSCTDGTLQNTNSSSLCDACATFRYISQGLGVGLFTQA